ncbi:protoporphyrinogen oxidase HemJ [Reinekea blandensis]|uniref:Protoporphyrinogen IX oxidase n=1 Tax=Reinekea blandensis MED297 TaxID=314283 RepID=A4BAG9_9GAMM|nr:protoporphyrinogen oxidase HemJ [Reinekea blandensis]EAR10925.1 predicted membrane protein [Reinekea sp. MED297] [Reinekea blandensis MED297]
MLYLWIKALHIIFVINWFAGIFYLPRLFVYHAMAEDKPSKERFKIMERKLYRGIMTPSMVLALVFGIWMLFLIPGYLSAGWMHAKLLFVVAVVVYHFWCGRILRQFRDDKNERSHVWFRWFNEAPVIALFAIVIFVVVKPF